MENNKPQTLGELVGADATDEFESFNLQEIQEVLYKLATDQPIDEANALVLQQQALWAADILIEFIAKLTKTVSSLEHKVKSATNKASLNYKAEEGRTTIEQRKWAGEADPEVENLNVRLARAKGAKTAVERKYEILIKAHHHFKDIAQGHRKLNGTNPLSTNSKREDNGWG